MAESADVLNADPQRHLARNTGIAIGYGHNDMWSGTPARGWAVAAYLSTWSSPSALSSSVSAPIHETDAGADLRAVTLARLWQPTAPATRRRGIAGLLEVPGDPFNLAVARVIWFAGFLVFVRWRWKTRFADLNPALLDPPVGVPFWLAEAALRPALASMVAWAMIAGAVAAMIGWHTRMAASVVAVGSVYVLGLPQLFAKVDHSHHLVWISVVFAVAPCADVLSIDAWRSRKRSGDVEPHPRYGLPLRVIWLLLGLIYFFPGFWKLANVGPEWALSDNVRNQLWAKWSELGGWIPLVRVDEWPIAYQTIGVVTLVFELGFVFAVFSPRWRGRWGLLGLCFHTGTYLLMRISFVTLWPAYGALPDWRGWAIRRARRPKVAVAAPTSAAAAMRLDVLRRFDICARIELVSVAGLDLGDLSQYRKAWCGLPWWGRFPPPSAGRGVSRGRRASADRWVRLTAVALITPAALSGAGAVSDAWPFAAYPAFDYRAAEQTTRVDTLVRADDGRLQPWPDQAVRERLGTARFLRLVFSIHSEEADERQRRGTRALARMLRVPDDKGLVIHLVATPADPDLQRTSDTVVDIIQLSPDHTK